MPAMNRDKAKSAGSLLVVSVYAIIGIAIAAAPIFLASIPPLADYPNHLARVYILDNLGRVPELALYYRDVSAAQPNLTFDCIVSWLARIMSLEMAGKVFLALTITAMVAGVVALHRALHARTSLWPLLSLFFVYNRLFLWGFVGYLFALGIAIAAFAGWVALHRRPVIRMVMATGLATLLYLGHLYAFGVYVLCIVGYEFTVLWDGRRPTVQAVFGAVAATVQFVPALYLFLFVSPTSDAAGETHWGSLWRKLEAPANLLFNYHLAFDLACLAILASVVLVGLVRRHLVVNRLMIGPLVLLFTAFVLMPDQFFSSYGADKRLPIAIALVAIAASEWRSWKWYRLIAVSLSAVFLLRMALIAAVWIEANATYSDYMTAIERVPYGAKLMVIVAHPSQRSLPPIPVFEIANMAIIYRHAFVPSLFAFPRHAAQAVAFSPKMQRLSEATPHHIFLPHILAGLNDPNHAQQAGPFREELLNQYDCLFIVNERDMPVPPPHGATLFEGRDVRLVNLH
ncbi:MAG TPA: hypothetical protein VJR03_04330 [Nitrospira sp.]|nr:hypothetical protein [Nitrospira sp.]